MGKEGSLEGPHRDHLIRPGPAVVALAPGPSLAQLLLVRVKPPMTPLPSAPLSPCRPKPATAGKLTHLGSFSPQLAPSFSIFIHSSHIYWEPSLSQGPRWALK